MSTHNGKSGPRRHPGQAEALARYVRWTVYAALVGGVFVLGEGCALTALFIGPAGAFRWVAGPVAALATLVLVVAVVVFPVLHFVAELSEWWPFRREMQRLREAATADGD